MKASTKDIGEIGEKLAEIFLLKAGFKIIRRNWRFQGGEIDIIAISPDGKLCFFEVKMRLQREYGEPEESINPAKVERIKMGAELFLSSHPEFQNMDVRFDVIAVELRHIEDAF